MKLNLFKGLNKAVAPLVAKKIKKEDFLEELREAWYPLIKKNTDIEAEVKDALERVEKSGFSKVFKTVGITDEDIRQLLTEIQESKTATIRNENKIGRNEPCPCGSNKKYKKCCGGN